MRKALNSRDSNQAMAILSRLLLPPRDHRSPDCAVAAENTSAIAGMSRAQFETLLELASLNHVSVRGLEVFRGIAANAADQVRAGWAEGALAVEQSRIRNATMFLEAICSTFEEHGYAVTVIKSLDHWPDLGVDLDLYTNADASEVFRVMQTCFDAEFASRSWGDRLACKWNFILPGLREAVEIHIGRLGQTGEQVEIAAGLPARARSAQFGDHRFRVSSISDRLLISTLQRMYRHFFFRLCDIVDTASLVDSGEVDFEHLRSLARSAGIWEGAATYLAIVSDYVEQYRGLGLDVPGFVKAAARFGAGHVHFRHNFLRVPIMPQSASLYRLQLAGLLRRRELHNSARLGLLPWLATAAMVGQKITGSDKGIW